MNVRVFHNTSTRFGLRRYRHGDRLTLVARYGSDATDVEATLGTAWHLFNVGDDPAFGPPSPIAVAYRARRNRSLCIGDVIEVDGAAYAVDRLGFTEIDGPLRITNLTTAGSTALDLDPAELAPLLDWHSDEPGAWMSFSVECPPGHNPNGRDDYLDAAVATAEPIGFRWRVDHHESTGDRPAESVRAGEAATLPAAQAAAEEAIRALIASGDQPNAGPKKRTRPWR